MIISLKLSNWKSHKSTELNFSDGTNILLGNMGAGKSSILQAISFALFGTFAELKSRGLKISETISRGSKIPSAEIELKIKTSKGILTIQRRIDGKKGTSEGTVRDEEGKLLAGPNPTSINDYISKLLRLDEAVFLRAVYGMQNEIDSILRLGPGERKKCIDELMGLDKFEVARKTAGALSNRIKTELGAAQRIIANLKSEDLDKQSEELKTDINKQINEQKKLSEELIIKQKEETIYKTEIERFRAESEQYNTLLERIKNRTSQIGEITSRLIGVELKQDVSQVEQEEKGISNKIDELTEKKKVISDNFSNRNSSLVKIERESAVVESKLGELVKSLGEFQRIEIELEAIKTKHGISDLRSEIMLIESDVKSKDEQIKINLAEMENLRRHLEELTSMEGLCPLCKTNLNEQDRNRLISSIKKDLAEHLYSNKDANESIDKLKQKKVELEGIFEKFNKNLDELANKEKIRSDKNQIESELENLVRKRVNIKSELFKIETQSKEIDSHISELIEKRDKIFKNKHLYELKNKKIQLESELVKLNEEKSNYKVDPETLRQAEESFQSILRKVQELKTRLEGFERLLHEKNLRYREIEEKKKKISELEMGIKSQQEKAEFLDKFKNALQATQLELRDDLILSVNEVMGSAWLEIYPYSTWSGVRLAVDENDYILQIKDAEGDWVNVSGFASGGERMLAALAMRISFARVMVPTLSLLILDEPTHNLDEKAIQTFIEVIQERVSEFIDQILIVTHEEKLAESGKNIIRLEN